MSELCPRRKDVEALFDQRLGPDEAPEVELHLASCTVCQQLRSELTQLRAALRESHQTPNAFVMKRLRRETLERAGAGGRPMVARARWPRVVMVAATLLMVVGAILGTMLWLRSDPSEAVSVVPGPGASFTRERDGTHDIVRLIDGTFDFDVQSHEGGQRLLVIVPDGEIEDIGTRFRVIVQDGATIQVSVSSGEVEFRKVGSVPLRIIAGMTYHPLAIPPSDTRADASAQTSPPSPLPSASTPAAVATATNSAGPSTRRALPATASSAKGTAVATTSSAQAPAPATSSATESSGLTEEDVEYLRIVHLLRSGKQAEAQAAASRYLAKFPQGLRRREVEAVRAAGAPVTPR